MSVQKATEIIKSWRNYCFSDPEVEEIAKKRAEVCSGCEHAKFSKMLNVFVKDANEKIQGYKCNRCQCPLSALTRNTGQYKCRENKWEK